MKKQEFVAGRWVKVLLCLVLCCGGWTAAEEWYYGGVSVDIDREVLGFLWIDDATVNLYQNVWVKDSYNSAGQIIEYGEVYVNSGAVLNIFGGKVDGTVYISTSYNGMPEADVTIYGSQFAKDGVAVEPGTTELFLPDNILSGVYQDGTPFSFHIGCFWESDFYMTVKLGWITSTPQISATPEAADFGQVEVGAAQAVTATVTNTGNANLSLQSLDIVQAAGAGFAITPIGQLPRTVEPGSIVEVQVVFAPSAAGAVSAMLQVASDDPENPVVEVMLTGTGFESEPTPAEQIAAINGFYSQALQNGTIVGVGAGKSAPNKAAALGAMLSCAKDMIDSGDVQLTLSPLSSAEKKTDGQDQPVDFVAGTAVGELNAMINELISAINAQ